MSVDKPFHPHTCFKVNICSKGYFLPVFMVKEFDFFHIDIVRNALFCSLRRQFTYYVLLPI